MLLQAGANDASRTLKAEEGSFSRSKALIEGNLAIYILNFAFLCD
jgi:hypothetical protein